MNLALDNIQMLRKAWKPSCSGAASSMLALRKREPGANKASQLMTVELEHGGVKEASARKIKS